MNQAYQAIRRNTTAPAATKTVNFPALLERSKGEIAKALPRHLNPDRMMRIALTAFRNTPKLAECNPLSVLAAVVQASQLGLEIGMLGEAYLVPYKGECQLIPGYAGLMKLARQSGQVADIYAHEVRENDVFHLRLGMSRELAHEPLPGKGGFPATESARGEITGFYAVCVFKDGTNTFVAASIDDVCRIRDRSNGYKAAKKFNKDSPWDTDFVEMGKKTVIRALAKVIPKSPELATALAMDSAVDAGVTQNISLQQAADGTYEPEMVSDPETGEIHESDLPPQRSQPVPSAPAGRTQRAAKPVEDVESPQFTEQVKAEAPQQQQFQQPAPAESSNAAALDRYLTQMDEVVNQDDLNEIYIRAEQLLRNDADRAILDRQYNKTKSRLDQGGLF